MSLQKRARFAQLARIDLSGVELMVGVIAITWGLRMIFDPGLFAIDGYRGFVDLHMDAPRVGVLMSVLGTALLAALIDGRASWRRFGLMASIAFWAFMAGVFFLAPTIGNTPYLAVLFSVHSLLALLSLRATNLPLSHG